MSSGFIRRPVATGLLMVAIVLLGATAISYTPPALKSWKRAGMLEVDTS